MSNSMLLGWCISQRFDSPLGVSGKHGIEIVGSHISQMVALIKSSISLSNSRFFCYKLFRSYDSEILNNVSHHFSSALTNGV